MIAVAALSVVLAILSDFARRSGRTDAQVSTLLDLLERARGMGFDAWARDEDEGYDETPDSVFDMLVDWLDREHDIVVRDDGLVEFRVVNRRVRRLLDGIRVVVFHHTCTGAMRSISERGLVPRDQVPGLVRSSNPHMNSGAGVYVTTEWSGTVVDHYSRNACNRMGGDQIMLTIVTYIDELEPDPDDLELSNGRFQFVLDYVPTERILELRDK